VETHPLPMQVVTSGLFMSSGAFGKVEGRPEAVQDDSRLRS
jgi:hypothetical protein